MSAVTQRCSRLVGLLTILWAVGQSEANRTDAPRPPPRDCSELPAGAPSGVYLLQLGPGPSLSPVSAYCDLEKDGGRWTVIQRRRDIKPRQNFNQNYTEYQAGFGDLHGEFWFGLESLWKLTGTNDLQFELRVNLADFEGETRYATYREFRVASKADGYLLTVSGYNGTAGDALTRHSGFKFSTSDYNAYGVTEGSCAQEFKCGWWFNFCYGSLLNGPYLSGKHDKVGGINWVDWRGEKYSLKETEMKIRPLIRPVKTN